VSEPSSCSEGSLQAGPDGSGTDQLITAGNTLVKDSSDRPADGVTPIHKKEEILTEREERKEYI
jgi:hypothetical protein